MKINPILKKFESSLINSNTLINDQKKMAKKRNFPKYSE